MTTDDLIKELHKYPDMKIIVYNYSNADNTCNDEQVGVIEINRVEIVRGGKLKIKKLRQLKTTHE